MKPLLFVFVLFFAFSTVFAQDAAKNLYALFDSEWQWSLENNPTFASYLGDKRYNNRWNDQSIEAIKKRNQHRVETLAKLKQINRAALSDKDKVNYDLFQKDYESATQNYETRLYLLPVNQRGGIQTSDELAEFLQFQTVKDYEDWIARLDAFPVLMEQTLALMKTGKAEKMIWSRQILTRVPAQIEKQIVADAELSAFYAPLKKFPRDISAADQIRLKRQAKEAVATKIIPSFVKLKTYFETEYLPAAYPEAGIWQMKNGDKIYEFLARDYTTTVLTPKEIHEKGLREVARIRAEMEKIKEQVEFKGTLQEFFQYLRSDEKFFYKTPAELLTAYRAISKRIDPELVRVFRTFPKMPYGVVPIPDKIAPDTTTAYYNSPAADGSRPGLYYVNLYKPETRPKWEMMALSIHEAVPGHHFQLALQQELGEVPNFRKFGGYTAFIEGWGLYSESLGDEMGLYSDPYDKFGQLTYEMWRAVRLVVDTGMHYFKWDRTKAIDFFKDNAAKTEQDIVNEIDRYISDPGQALAYKIGELKIKELRAKSKQELGSKFDVKEFHDVVLLSGAVPLDVLEKNVGEWIAKKKAKP
jgi:uncharacterized protein (DUF885 family)